MNENLLLLGEIKGRLDHIRNDQEVLIRKMEAIDSRLRAVEIKSALSGAVTGAIVSLTIAFIKQQITGTA